MNEIIMEAIRESRLLEFIYNGAKRVVEPYTLGVSRGQDTLSAYEVDGKGDSSQDLCWQEYAIEDIEKLNISNNRFIVIRDGYNRNNRQFNSIYATL